MEEHANGMSKITNQQKVNLRNVNVQGMLIFNQGNGAYTNPAME